MREKISDVVLTAVAEFNETYEKSMPMELGETIPLYGKHGVLDSLGLVSLVVLIEQSIEDQMGVAMILADEKAMSQTTSPFQTTGHLIDYICRLLNEETQACANP